MGNENVQGMKEKKKDVIIQENLRIGKQVVAAASTENSLLCMIVRLFVNREEEKDVEIV